MNMAMAIIITTTSTIDRTVNYDRKGLCPGKNCKLGQASGLPLNFA